MDFKAHGWGLISLGGGASMGVSTLWLGSYPLAQLVVFWVGMAASALGLLLLFWPRQEQEKSGPASNNRTSNVGGDVGGSVVMGDQHIHHGRETAPPQGGGVKTEAAAVQIGFNNDVKISDVSSFGPGSALEIGEGNRVEASGIRRYSTPPEFPPPTPEFSDLSNRELVLRMRNLAEEIRAFDLAQGRRSLEISMRYQHPKEWKLQEPYRKALAQEEKDFQRLHVFEVALPLTSEAIYRIGGRAPISAKFRGEEHFLSAAEKCILLKKQLGASINFAIVMYLENLIEALPH